jgi:hypothetical protein
MPIVRNTSDTLILTSFTYTTIGQLLDINFLDNSSPIPITFKVHCDLVNATITSPFFNGPLTQGFTNGVSGQLEAVRKFIENKLAAELNIGSSDGK